MTEPLYALIWAPTPTGLCIEADNHRHHRVCPDLFVTQAEAIAHRDAEHADLPATEVRAVRSDLLGQFWPTAHLDAPDAILRHADKDGAPC